jgi:hypothetical protein
VEAIAPVNGAQRVRRLLVVVSLAALCNGLGGCAFHATGLATPTPAGPTLVEIDGTSHRLLVGPDAAPLSHLDGHTIRVEGQKVLGAVRVTDWSIQEGLHGMPVWVGPVKLMGAQVGVEDRNSGAFYWVDDAAARTLSAHAGSVVLVEGYVDGPHRVRALYWRLLEGP